MTTETLQDVINKRAEAKLKKDLNFLANLYVMDNFKYSQIFEKVFVNIGTAEKPENVKAINVFSSNRRIYREAFDKNIDRYIKDETELFLKEIEQLKERVETLEGDIQNTFNYNQ